MTSWSSIEGLPYPLGVSWSERDRAYNFALYSKTRPRCGSSCPTTPTSPRPGPPSCSSRSPTSRGASGTAGRPFRIRHDQYHPSYQVARTPCAENAKERLASTIDASTRRCRWPRCCNQPEHEDRRVESNPHPHPQRDLAASPDRDNRLVRLDEAAKARWAQVENAYQRRADLVPNLIETVKGAAALERGTLEAVTAARSRVGQVAPASCSSITAGSACIDPDA